MTLQFLWRKKRKEEEFKKKKTAIFPPFFFFWGQVFFFLLHSRPPFVWQLLGRSGRVGWLLLPSMSSLLFFFFFPTRFSVSVVGYFPSFSFICRRELVRLAKERKDESERRHEPSGSFRLLYRRFNVSAVVKGRQTMSSVSHLSLSL